MRRVFLAVAVLGISLICNATGRAQNPYAPDVLPALGDYRVLVILATWGPQPFTQAEVQHVVFDETDAFYRAQSFGKLRLTGTVTPWLTAFSGPVDCAQTTVSRGGKAAAIRAGFDPSAYDVVIYLHPALGCPWSGVTVGHEIWLNGALSRKLVAHELGHTMGLQHANTTLCAVHSCDALEYGDPYDTMGQGNGDFSAWNKYELGWITKLEPATRNGSYTIDPLELPSSSPQAFVVTTAQNQYWLENRIDPGHSDFGFDVDPGVLVHVTPSPDIRAVFSVSLLRNLLLVDPALRGRPELHAGDRFTVPGAFTLTLTHLPAGGRADVRFDWTDTTRPGAPRLLTPLAHSLYGRLDVSWNEARETGSGVAYYRVTVDGGRVVRVNGEADDLSAVYENVRAGRHRVRVVAVDRAGNVSEPSSRVTIVSR